MEIDVTPETKREESENVDKSVEEGAEDVSATNTPCTSTSSNTQSKKIIKHALRQQAKRRRKNTTIASGNSSSTTAAPVPRIIVKPLPPQPVEELAPVPAVKTPTMREVLASIPGFSIKPRKRSNKKLSTAAQLEQTKEGCIDLETPDSILVNTNLRALLNKYTFASLPPLYQNKLVQLLPSVDRQTVTNSSSDMPIRLSTSGLTNEFFARACVEWQERLGEGEFTPENQQKLKLEADKERSRVDPWKLKHFEPIWGDRSASEGDSSSMPVLNAPRPPIKTTIKLRPSTTVNNKPKPPLITRLRTVGAMTRSCTNFKKSELSNQVETTVKSPIPDLLPIKTHKSLQRQELIASQLHSSIDKSGDHVPDVSVINISDSLLQTNEETIISFKENQEVNVHRLNEKRRRSTGSDVEDLAEEQPAKRMTPSPGEIEEEKLPTCSNSSEEDPLKITELAEEPPVSPSISEETVENMDTSEPQECLEEKEEIEISNEDDRQSRLETISLPELYDQTESESLSIEQEHKSELEMETTPTVSEYESVQTSEESKNELSELDYQEVADQTDADLNESFEMLPNTLILQQESVVLDKDCGSDVCMEESAEKLEASVEESDLVIAQLSSSNFEPGRNIGEDEANEDRFIDAENYVLESGQISIEEAQKEDVKQEDLQSALFGGTTIATAEDCCWSVVDSSTEKLLEVPLHALDSVPVGMVGADNPTEHVEVIPMQEELEVRLQEGSFPVPTDWNYDVKMDSEMVAAALGNPEQENGKSKPHQFQEYSGNQVKLELEVTLTPEIISNDRLITSTVSGGSVTTNLTVTPAVSKTVATVIPPTTIVCLPSVVSTSPMMHQAVNQVTQCAPPLPRPGMVQSSSALPYLALSTSQPIRAVSTHSKAKPKSSQTGNNRNRSNNKPPPGAVNLERSYQICQAVIQNSPNRDQLKCQLKPPPSLLAAAAANNAKKAETNRQNQYNSVSTNRTAGKTFTPPLPATGTYQMVPGSNGVKNLAQKTRTVPFQQQRQPSPPVVVRHVFTSGQGIPVTMAVLPQAQTLSPEVVEGQTTMGQVGQYILVQRAGIADPHNIPRSSSAPPSQQQLGGIINTGGTSQLVSVGARSRPASVDIEHPAMQVPSNDFVMQCPNPGTQAVTRRQRLPPGVVYGDVSVENQLHNYTIIGDNVMIDHPGAQMQPQQVLKVRGANNMILNDQNCSCSLKAMVMCKKCGAFCHDDCIGPNKLCRTCFIR